MPKTKPRTPGHTENQTTEQVLDAAKCFGLELQRRDAGVISAGGRTVFGGKPGDPDWYGTIPRGPNEGRTIYVELKRGDFDPRKLKGSERKRFPVQLARLKELNAQGALALWVRDGGDFAHFLGGWVFAKRCWVEIDEQGFCWVHDEGK